MKVLMGPAPCAVCRVWLYLGADRRWRERDGSEHVCLRLRKAA